MSSEKEHEKSNETVQVVVRSRPLNEKEKSSNCFKVVNIITSGGIVEIYDPKYKELDHFKKFVYDSTYNCDSTNLEIYEVSVRPLVLEVLKGFNATIFAYGQSGSGKTYTMEGVNNNDEGIIPRTFNELFDSISKSLNMQYLIRASYLEIYQDEIRDLLSKIQKTCELRESPSLGSVVKNLSSFVCKDLKQMINLLETGKLNRVVGETDLNQRSSRSHAVFIITIEMRSTESLGNQIKVGKLNLVDLAGSERQNKTNAEGKRLREASKINLSLTALGNVIAALTESREVFVPYRDSKLTRLLKNSLGGNSKTLMIANISPANCNYEESLNTLRFASRARKIQNQPIVNEDPVDTLLRKYQEEIEKLKNQLAIREESRRKRKLRSLRNKSPKTINNLQKSTLQITIDQQITKNESAESLSDGETFSNVQLNIYDQKYIDDLSKRIETMENKILSGRSNMSLLDHTCEQQKTILAKNDQINMVKEREQKVQKLILFNVKSTEEIRGDYTSLQQEVDEKSKQLLKKTIELKSIQQEINDVKEEFNRDLRELVIDEYELLKDLKLRLMILKQFVPKQDQRRLLSRLVFDNDEDEWKITSNSEPKEISFRPTSKTYVRRPVSLFSLVAQRKVNHIYRCNRTQENRKRTFRFKGENLLELDLYKCPHKVQDGKLLQVYFSFKAALKEEDDITIDAADSTFRRELGSTILSTKLLQFKKPKTKPKPVYPKARGLVPK